MPFRLRRRQKSRQPKGPERPKGRPRRKRRKTRNRNLQTRDVVEARQARAFLSPLTWFLSPAVPYSLASPRVREERYHFVVAGRSELAIEQAHRFQRFRSHRADHVVDFL